MPNGTHAPHSTRPARNGEPQPAPPPTASEPATAKRDLTSWWKQFSKRGAVKKEEEKEPDHKGIFGVPLIVSIPYANVAISLFNETGESYIYGYVPIVVAKCGVFLKEKATDVEGIFRLAGSEKRIKELKIAFDTPPRWGKGLNWDGYTVHDAANILRRYFNQLPEPIIPLLHYDVFRQPLRNHQAEAVGQIEGQSPSIGGFNPDDAVRKYQHRIKELPSLNRQLLLYILDLLAVFAAKSDINKMTTHNLAAIFQPGILSHPQHDMAPQEYRLSQDVLIFLIDNQDHFLIGMEGTAVDEGTVKHVESGPSTPQARTPTTPGRNKSGLGRSASAASSAAADSIRKFGNIRRNVSTSSRHSRHSGAVPSPTTPSFGTPTGSGVNRSNTLPSKRSPALPNSRFNKDKTSGPPTPASQEERVPIASPAIDNVTKSESQVQSPPKPVEPTQAAPPTQNSQFAKPVQQQPPKIRSMLDIGPVDVVKPTKQEPVGVVEPAKPVQEEKLDVVKPVKEAEPEVVNPATDEVVEFPRPTPTDVPGAYPLPTPLAPSDEEILFSTPASTTAAQALMPPAAQPQGRLSPQISPLREKSEFVEGPIDSGPSVDPAPAVRTFTQILSKVSPTSEEKKEGRRPNKLQKKPRHGPNSSNPSAHSSTHSLTGPPGGLEGPPSPLPQTSMPHSQQPTGSKEMLQSYNNEGISSRNSGATLKPTMSPSASFRSHSTATEYSETEEPHKEEKRGFWKSHKRGESKATPTASQADLSGSIPGADKSMSSFGSSSGWGGGGRRSLQYDSHQGSEASMLYGSPDSKGHDKKGLSSWFRDRKQDREAKKQRAKSPPPGTSSELSIDRHLARPVVAEGHGRGRSMEIPRTATSEESKGSSDVTPTGTSPNPTLPLSSPTKPIPLNHSGHAFPGASGVGPSSPPGNPAGNPPA